jgi:hypothetical protein
MPFSQIIANRRLTYLANCFILPIMLSFMACEVLFRNISIAGRAESMVARYMTFSRSQLQHQGRTRVD